MSNDGAYLTPGETFTGVEIVRRAINKMAVIALLAIALGFVMQGLILTARLGSGGVFPEAFAADLAQGVTWSLLVCTGVGLGVSVVKARAVLAGLIAMLFAPLAIAAAKSAQKVMTTLLGAAENPAVLSLATISTLRAVEYGVLGWMLAKLARKDVAGAAPYFGAGALIGVVFGGAIVALTYQVAVANGVPQDMPKIAATLVNEILSPIGCAVLIYTAQFVGGNLRTITAQQP